MRHTISNRELGKAIQGINTATGPVSALVCKQEQEEDCQSPTAPSVLCYIQSSTMKLDGIHERTPENTISSEMRPDTQQMSKRQVMPW